MESLRRARSAGGAATWKREPARALITIFAPSPDRGLELPGEQSELPPAGVPGLLELARDWDLPALAACRDRPELVAALALPQPARDPDR